MESPVWTPTGSRFSMLQMVMTLPAPSRMTSYSISFHPAMQRSTSTWPTRLHVACRWWRSACSCSVVIGDAAAGAAEGIGWADDDRASQSAFGEGRGILHGGRPPRDSMQGWPIFSMASLKPCRSSARRMDSAEVPSSATPYCASVPSSASAMARFRPVCPPRVGRMTVRALHLR